jgi:cytoskeletal protein CcmA (bactofilin family)
MTVGAFTDSANRLTFTQADDSTVGFSFNFEIADANSIAVFVDNVKKSITADYSVTFDSGDSGTGTVVFTSAPSSGASVILKRDTHLVRATDFQTSGSFTAAAINSSLDRLMQGLQEVDDKVENRTLRVDSFQTTPTDFTIPSSRANAYLKFDSGGDVTVSTSFDGSTISTTGDVSVGGQLSVTGATSVSTITASGNITGTLATASQPNVTSLGTLTSLTVDNLTLNSNQIASSTGTIALDDNTSVNGTLTATNLAGTLTTAAQGNVTSLGTLTNLQVDNVNVNGNTVSASSGNLTLNNVTSFTVDNLTLDGNTLSSSTGNVVLDASGNIDANSNRIINLNDPVDNTDAASKGWVTTTLTNAGVQVGSSPTFQTTIQNGSSTVSVVTTDGDTHIVNASSTLYKFKAAEFESVKPIVISDEGFYSHKDELDTVTFSLPANQISFLVGPITVKNGATVDLGSTGKLRVI